MLDGAALRKVVAEERPHIIIPEIEAIATDELAAFEASGVRVVPTARATRLTMDREGIRRLAAEELGIPTSPYRFVDSEENLAAASSELGFPCVVKPVMSSSGRGQSVVRGAEDVASAWAQAQTEGRASGGATRVIVEGFVDFDYEITLLTVRHSGGTTFLEPIGHHQVDGDYRESWQPQPMSPSLRTSTEAIAGSITEALGGWGVFGVELFVVGDQVVFSEVSPRPHDTGLVTLASQDLSEFALHALAVLGLPIPVIEQRGPAASRAIVVEGRGVPVVFGVEDALAQPGVGVRLFGKPSVDGHRRVGVVLARGDTLQEAREACRKASAAITVELHPEAEPASQRP
jgi:phosphoribosylglycinamide formyltransferase 2